MGMKQGGMGMARPPQRGMVSWVVGWAEVWWGVAAPTGFHAARRQHLPLTRCLTPPHPSTHPAPPAVRGPAPQAPQDGRAGGDGTARRHERAGGGELGAVVPHVCCCPQALSNDCAGCLFLDLVKLHAPHHNQHHKSTPQAHTTTNTNTTNTTNTTTNHQHH